MLRTSTVLLSPDYDMILKEYAEYSAIFWNNANFERRKALFNHEKMPSYVAQWREIRTSETYKKLGAAKSQALLQKLDEAWQSFFALRRMLKDGKLPPSIRVVKPPRYWKVKGKRAAKAFYIRNDCWSITENTITVAKNVKIPYQSGELWVGKHGRLEVLRDELSGKWYAHFPISLTEGTCRNASKKASLDLGICNLATLYIEGKKPIVYSGRTVLSDWVYHTEKTVKLQSKLPRKQRTSKNILLLFRRRKRRLNHAINALCRNLFEVLDAEEVGELVIGDLNPVRFEKDKSYRVRKSSGFWVFNQVEERLEELGEEYGVKVSQVSEADTSRTCCLCGLVHRKTTCTGRVHRGLMVCPTYHTSINADVNGAVNIGDVAVNRFPNVRNTNNGVISSSRHLAMPLLLRWNYNKWC